MVAWTMLLALMSALVTASSATTPATISKYPRLVALPEQLTFEEAEEACLELRGTVAAPTEPHFEEYLEGQQITWLRTFVGRKTYGTAPEISVDKNKKQISLHFSSWTIALGTHAILASCAYPTLSVVWLGMTF